MTELEKKRRNWQFKISQMIDELNRFGKSLGKNATDDQKKELRNKYDILEKEEQLYEQFINQNFPNE